MRFRTCNYVLFVCCVNEEGGNNMIYLFQGFLLGLAYVAPIGMQNIYVINSAIRSRKFRAYQVALITSFFDISLALACFFGVGLIMDKIPLLRYFIMAVGSIAVIYIGYSLIKSVPSIDEEVDVDQPIVKVVWMCFVVTWLNPQALIDGSLLLGGYKASLPYFASRFFISGVATASLSWFLILTTIIIVFKKAIGDKILRYINIVCGAIIIFYGLKLGYSFIKLL